MGIETDPMYWSYGLSCGCWTPDFSPDTLYVHVSGIMMGDAWVPALGLPPNGGYALSQEVIPCLWYHTSDRQPDLFRTMIPGSELGIGALITYAFTARSNNNCAFYFVNSKQDPTRGFYGGHAIVFQREPTADTIVSIADIMELINMQGRESRKSEVFPLDSQHVVAMIADQVESTRIRIKYKFS